MKSKLVILIDVLQDIQAGAERQIYELIKGINKEKFSVKLYILHQKEAPQEIKALECEVKALGIKRIYDFNGIRQGFKFADTLKKEKTDILMTYHFGSDIWGTVFGKFASVPLITSNRRDEGFWKKKNHIAAYKFVNRWVNKIIVVSNAVKKVVVESENVNPDKIEVIHNGVDVKRFEISQDISKKRRELKLAESAPIIGCVGNLRPIKGQKYLIEAAAKALKRFSEAQFLFVGTGEIKDSLVSQAKQLNIESNIQFLGKRSDIPELLSIMDVCVLPSLSEGLSNALLEYMAAGKPIISTRLGGNAELITHNEDGLLVEPTDSNILAEAIISLLDSKELRQRLAEAAKRKAVENYTIQRMIQKYEYFLEAPFSPENPFSNPPFVPLLQRGNEGDFKGGQKGDFNSYLPRQRRGCCPARKKQDMKVSFKIKKEIRICHIVSSNGLFGAEKVMLSLASNMNYNGLKSWIAAVKNSHNPHTEIIEAAKNKNIPTITIESRGRLDFKSVGMLCEFIRQNKIDIIHTHNYKANFLGLLAAKKAKIPIVATLHGYIGDGAKLKLYEAIDRFILWFFNKIILVDNSMRKWFKNGSINAAVINNGVDIEESQGRKVARSQDLVIGTVGRLSPEKGHRYLLEAFAKIAKDYPDIKLLIVGDGKLRAELENLSASLGIKERVEFSGFQRDVSQYYNLMDIYVSSSLIEHFPLSVLEAMSYGKAIVATDVGGVSKLIKDGVTGLLINPISKGKNRPFATIKSPFHPPFAKGERGGFSGKEGDLKREFSDEIYNALVTLIKDASLRKTLGENAKQFVEENYSLERMAESYKKVYEEVSG